MNTVKNALDVIRQAAATIQSEVDETMKGADPFSLHVYRSRKLYRSTDARDNKSGKKTERMVMESARVARELGFVGSDDAWLQILRAYAPPKRENPLIFD